MKLYILLFYIYLIAINMLLLLKSSENINLNCDVNILKYIACLNYFC